MIPGDCRTITWEVGWISGLINKEGLHVEVTGSAASAGGSAFGYCIAAS